MRPEAPGNRATPRSVRSDQTRSRSSAFDLIISRGTVARPVV